MKSLEDGVVLLLRSEADSPERHQQLWEQWRFQCDCEEKTFEMLGNACVIGSRGPGLAPDEKHSNQGR